jgi:hypothetical protein
VNDREDRLSQRVIGLDIPPLRRLLADLGTSEATATIRDSAAGSLGHLVCQACARALEEEGDLGPGALSALPGGLRLQHSLLTLDGSVDALLDSGPFVSRYGQQLCDTLLRRHDDVLNSQPI